MSDPWFFEKKYAKNICDNFIRRLNTKRTGSIFRSLQKNYSEEIACFVDGLCNHGVNRDPTQLAEEIQFLKANLQSDPINLGLLYLVGPAIRNEISIRLSEIEGYPGRGALELHIIFDYLIPLYKMVNKHLSLDKNYKDYLFMKSILFELDLQLDDRPQDFPSFPDSTGYVECQFLIETEPLKSLIDKAEKLIQNNLDRSKTFKEAFYKTKHSDREKIQAKVTYISANKVEKILNSCMVKKTPLQGMELTDLENAIIDVLRDIHSNFAKEILTLSENQPQDYFDAILDTFSHYFSGENEPLNEFLMKKYERNIKREIFVYKLENQVDEVLEIIERKIKKAAIPSFKEISKLIMKEIVPYINEKLESAKWYY